MPPDCRNIFDLDGGPVVWRTFNYPHGLRHGLQLSQLTTDLTVCFRSTTSNRKWQKSIVLDPKKSPLTPHPFVLDASGATSGRHDRACRHLYLQLDNRTDANYSRYCGARFAAKQNGGADDAITFKIKMAADGDDAIHRVRLNAYRKYSPSAFRFVVSVDSHMYQ